MPSPKLADHHIFPQQFKKFFKSKGINVDVFTVTLGQKTHLKGVHGKGLGKMPTQKWNAEWKAFIDKNPTTKEIYQKAGEMLDRYNLSHVPIHPYKQ